MAGLVKQAQDVVGAVVGSLVVPPLEVGSKVPTNVGLSKVKSPAEATFDLGATLQTGKNIILGVPGAFSGTCSNQIPGYIENAEKFSSKGVQGIYVVAVNDQFVTDAWKEKLGAEKAPIITIIADDLAKFTKAAGMDFASEPFFGNRRSKRYAAVVENGVVSYIFVEQDPTKFTETAAEAVLPHV